MRIGYDATLLRSEPAGVEKTVASLLRAMVELETGDEFLVYCGRRFKPPKWLQRPNVRLRRMLFPSSWRLARVFWQQLRLPFRAARDNVEVFHGPAYVLPQYIHAPAVLNAADAIALTHPHLCTRGTVSHLKRFLAKSCRLAGRIITPTQASADALVGVARADPDKIRVIPHGIHEHFRTPMSRGELEDFRQQQGLPPKFALFVGQIEPKKNLVQLVKAFFAARMNRSLPHKLLLVGKPAWGFRQVARAIRTHKQAGNIFLTGYLPDKALPALYRLADALLFPSVVEGFGIPALEAAASATPILISRDPALQEVAGDAALSVDANDLPELRAGIERVLTDEQLRTRLSQAGPARAADFTWERAARATIEVYKELLQEDRKNQAEFHKQFAEATPKQD